MSIFLVVLVVVRYLLPCLIMTTNDKDHAELTSIYDDCILLSLLVELLVLLVVDRSCCCTADGAFNDDDD